MDWPQFFWIVLKSGLFSTGGFGPLPSLHGDLIGLGWATERQFTEALAVGQLSPGPNGLWVVSLSYLVGGGTGALLAMLALLLPPLFVLLVLRGYEGIASHPATHGVLDGIVLVIAGTFIVILGGLLLDGGVDFLRIAIAVISAWLAVTRRLPVNAILILAALAGLALYWR